MQDFISDIYKYASLTSSIREIVRYSREELESEVKIKWNLIQQTIMDFCVLLTENGDGKGKELLDLFISACSYVNGTIGDYSEFADILETAIPIVYESVRIFGDIDITEGKYRLFSSKSGYLTVENIDVNKKFHSSYDPMWEAYERAQVEYDTNAMTYKILGCGLGYLPYQLYYASHGSVDIEIYHNDSDLVDYAINYGVLSMIPGHKLKIYVEKDDNKLLSMFLGNTSENVAYSILPDAICSLPPEQADKVFELDALNRTRIHISRIKEINYKRNIYNVKKVVNDFKPQTESDDWVVVAGGPSVDAHMDFLKENAGKKVIICASTIYNKLICSGIVPDCVAVLDPHDRTYGHFKNIADESVPLVMGAIANWQFSEYYRGDKYLVPGMDNREISDYFDKCGQESWFLGTTISTMLFEIAVHGGAKRIHFMGVDLSYPDGKSHASNTMDSKTVETNNMIDVTSVNGKMVKTTPQFLIYYREIQKKILDHKDIEFINYSLDGIKFEGTKWYKRI